MPGDGRREPAAKVVASAAKVVASAALPVALGAGLLAASGGAVPPGAAAGGDARDLERSSERGAARHDLAVAYVPAHAYLDGPPPGHTGGFGEPACQRCHFDAPVNPPGARLELRGLPDRFRSDSTYRLSVMVAAPDLGRAGFEASVRCAGGGHEGRQAGRLSAGGPRVEVVRGGGEELTGDSAVQYARHTREGSRTTGPDTATWQLAWAAPVAGCPSIVLHAAGNAANGDASEFGDRVLTGEWTAERADGGTVGSGSGSRGSRSGPASGR